MTLTDARSRPRRPLSDPDTSHDWTPQADEHGMTRGYYCPDCLIAGAPVSAPCPDRVGWLRARLAVVEADRAAARVQLDAWGAIIDATRRDRDGARTERDTALARVRGLEAEVAALSVDRALRTFTVADLDRLPVGACFIDRKDDAPEWAFTKQADGMWDAPNASDPYTSADMLATWCDDEDYRLAADAALRGGGQ